MRKKMRKVAEAMQIAVNEMLEREAKLGHKVIIGDKYGKPKRVSAKYLIKERKAAVAAACRREKTL